MADIHELLEAHRVLSVRIDMALDNGAVRKARELYAERREVGRAVMDAARKEAPA